MINTGPFRPGHPAEAANLPRSGSTHWAYLGMGMGLTSNSKFAAGLANKKHCSGVLGPRQSCSYTL